MNVMAQAHKIVKATLAQLGSLRVPFKGQYAVMLKAALKQAHKEYKAMNTQKTIKINAIASTLANDYFHATGYAVVGTVVDSEGNTVHVGESSGSEMRMENDAAYYMNSKNGFKKQDLWLQLYGVEGVIESFKIVK